MALSWRLFLNVLNDVGKVYEGRDRYWRLFKVLRDIEKVYRKQEKASAKELAAMHEKSARKIADVCLQNGAMWIKAAQYLSCRPDLLPQAYIHIFAELQTQSDNINAKPFIEVHTVLQECWGKHWDRYFKSFDLVPVASASIAQVYKGELQGNHIPNGYSAEVAIKVRVPAVETLYEQDQIVMRAIAKCLEPFFKEIDVSAIADELIAATNLELNFTHEAKNIRDYQKLSRQTQIYTPKVFGALSNEKVLVTEWVKGKPLQKMMRAKRQKQRYEEVIDQLSLTMLEDIFQHGLYHGDPHPGNVLVGQNINFIDFGLVGRLDPQQRFNYMMLMLAMMGQGSGTANDAPDYSRLFENAGFTAKDSGIFQEIGHYIEDLNKNESLAEQDRLESILNSLRRNRVLLPSGFVGIIRVILILNGLFQTTSLDFNGIFSRLSAKPASNKN